MIRPLALPPSPGLLALLALAFVLPGLAGHDPWKSFDSVGIEIAHQMQLTGDWLVPRIAGDPWLEDPPLYHWIALAFAALTGWVLPFHAAARLASASCVLAACAFLYWAARGLAREEDRDTAGPAAVLLLLGSVGLIVHAHESIPDHAAMAAACAAFAALVHFPRRPLAAGAAFGAALGLAFLATAIVVPLGILLAALVTWAVARQWRTGRHLGALVIATLLFALLAAAWPVALYLHDAELARTWWALLTAERNFTANLRYFSSILSWFAWPAWPLAAWALWSQRRQFGQPRLFAPFATFVLTLAIACRISPPQDISALVLLPPLALLGANAVAQLRRGAAAALDWFGVMTFTVFAALLWFSYFAMMTGMPARMARNFVKTLPGFVAQFAWLPLLVALAFTLAWIYLLVRTPRAATRGVLRWAAGVALAWGLFAMLIMPWADYQKSYRQVAEQLKAQLPAGAGCVAGRGLGAPQRAALSYHAGMPTPRSPTSAAGKAAAECRYLLVQGNPREELAPGAGWVKLADVGRPGDKIERFRLYHRGAK